MEEKIKAMKEGENNSNKIHFYRHVPGYVICEDLEEFEVDSFEELCERAAKWLRGGDVFATNREGTSLMSVSTVKANWFFVLGYVKGIDLRTKLPYFGEVGKFKKNNKPFHALANLPWTGKEVKKYLKGGKMLNKLLNKKVEITFRDNSMMTGMLSRIEFFANEYLYKVENYIFSKKQVKKVKEIK